ncbi:uncharacterized protein LOC127840334 [Dreissena polymorpha]|uniref:uncharacterized protein LOC127840334 n=1 Tax=Dreissena polymorpha TaxID=45954 RepID=UPI0022641365|nr:uncharacterized protein LOC127840334 [Dreissena polymorpha]
MEDQLSLLLFVNASDIEDEREVPKDEEDIPKELSGPGFGWTSPPLRSRTASQHTSSNMFISLRPLVLIVRLDNFRCPAERCRSETPGKWVCAKDGTNTYLNALGKIKCDGGCEADICKWGWKCGSSFHNGEYIKADFEGFVFAMSQAMQLSQLAHVKWITALMLELDKQYNPQDYDSSELC